MHTSMISSIYPIGVLLNLNINVISIGYYDYWFFKVYILVAKNYILHYKVC